MLSYARLSMNHGVLSALWASLTRELLEDIFQTLRITSAEITTNHPGSNLETKRMVSKPLGKRSPLRRVAGSSPVVSACRFMVNPLTSGHELL